MKKLMILAAMLALVAVFVVPAVAQGEGTDNNCPAFIINPAEGGQGGSVTGNTLTPTCTDTSGQQEFEQNRVTSGRVDNSNDVRVNGNGNTVNASPQQTGDTGNVSNEQGDVPVSSTQEDVDFPGATSEDSPSQTIGS